MTTVEIPGYKAGTWAIDPHHSEVSFSIRHLAIAKVRGTFKTFEGTITAPDNPLEAAVTARAEIASIDTGDATRDGHLRTGDFFDAEKFPYIEFISTGVRQGGSGYVIDGTLTIKGVAKPVAFDLELHGFQSDPYGNYKAGATVTGKIKRSDFGLNYNQALETGGLLLGDEVTINIDFEAALQA